eukprot:gene635-3945_t
MSTDPSSSSSSSTGGIVRPSDNGLLSYGAYLQLDTLLSCQKPESERVHGKLSHDEMLFITIHQTYELWFKQILFELDDVRQIFSEQYLEEQLMLQVVARLERIIEILKILAQQMVVIETMSPLDFLKFRSLLAPASGFQSVQFRLLENKLGIPPERRKKYHHKGYKWLERTPGLDDETFNFWSKLKENYEADVQKRRKNAEALLDEEKIGHLDAIQEEVNKFRSLFDEQAYEKRRRGGIARLSYRAMQGALLILFYRDQPRLHLPSKMLSLLMDIDKLMLQWRVNHLAMVQRMLGSRMGTGGSSGYLYLKETTSDDYKVFLDIFNLSTFLVPNHLLPQLSDKSIKLTVTLILRCAFLAQHNRTKDILQSSIRF